MRYKNTCFLPIYVNNICQVMHSTISFYFKRTWCMLFRAGVQWGGFVSVQFVNTEQTFLPLCVLVPHNSNTKTGCQSDKYFFISHSHCIQRPPKYTSK
jgi:hypothetical protein